MATLVEGNHVGEFLLSEGKGSISREQFVFDAAAPAMVSGTLVGKITASGKYTKYDNAAADGTQTCVGILYSQLDNLAVAQNGAVIVRSAEVAAARLTGSDAAGVADLLALGIIVR